MRQVLSNVFDLLIPLFDVSTSRMSNATFSVSTSHSTRTFLPNPTTFFRVAFDLLAILRYFWTTCRILASSMWNPQHYAFKLNKINNIRENATGQMLFGRSRIKELFCFAYYSRLHMQCVMFLAVVRNYAHTRACFHSISLL